MSELGLKMLDHHPHIRLSKNFIEIARPCVLGIVNQDRAAEIFARLAAQ